MEETLTTLNLPSSNGPTASGIFSTIKPCTIDVLLSYLTFLGNVKRDRREGRKVNESKIFFAGMKNSNFFQIRNSAAKKSE
jgi:hypothetical protein